MIKTKMFKSILLIVILFLSFVCISPVAQESVINNTAENVLSPQDVGTLIVENLLLRDYMYYGEDGLHYAEACAAVGALRFAALTEDKETLDRLISRYEILLDNESDLVSRKSHVDQNVIGIIPLQIYMITQDKRYLTQGLTFADSQWENPREDGLTSQTRWWIDDLYMVGMLQMQAFRATGEMKYADRAALQMAAYLERLQEVNGLFYHGPESPFFWGRGNGWVAVAMAEVLDSMPEDHKLRSDIMTHYQTMMKSLLSFQSDNGMWRQLIDYKDSWTESSCTAMFAYAMAVGMNNGWLDGKTYKPVVNKALNALIAHIDENGNVSEICVGTGKNNTREYYLARPRHSGDFHGQAPVLWLTVELY
ncbi:glycoside hydrolase family 105 protein [Candidatus Latescibacterota bacterium]